MDKKRYSQKQYNNQSPQEWLNNLLELYWTNQPYIKNVDLNHELEVRFGTKGIKNITKLNYDNVISKIKSLGFSSINEDGSYKLRIQSQFINPKTGKFMMSNIRTEINGYVGIKNYCNNNSIKDLMTVYKVPYGIEFIRKERAKDRENNYTKSINFDDFNFRVTYNTETTMSETSGIIREIIDSWEKNKKIFRYLNRVTFIHPSIPINIDTDTKYTSQPPSSAFSIRALQRSFPH